MPIFIYEAVSAIGVPEHGQVDLGDKQAVVEWLTKKQLIPLNIHKKGVVSDGRGLSMMLFSRFTALDRILMIRNLASIVKAGIDLIEAIDILIVDSTKPIVRGILSQAKANLTNGQPLWTTFQFYNQHFPMIVVGMVKAGEASGKLDIVLNELSVHLAKEYSLIKKVRSALFYPMILVIGSVGVIILLLTFVLPRLTKLFDQTGVALPLATRILLVISRMLTFSPILDIIIGLGLAWFLLRFRKTPLGRRMVLAVLVRLPVAKELVKKIALTRFTRTLGTMIASGIPILESLQLAADTVGNEQYKKIILESLEQVKKGISIAETFEKYPQLFPKFLTSLIIIGERTGTLENMLKTFADFYDEEVDNTLKDLTTLVEPLLLLFMGLLIGSLAFSILIPIYQLVGKFT